MLHPAKQRSSSSGGGFGSMMFHANPSKTPLVSMLGAPKDFRSLLDGNRELRPSFLAKKSDPEQREWKLGGYMINHGIFSASGEMLLCASRDLLLVNVTTGHTTTLAAAESGTFVEACALSPDDGTLAAAALGSRLAIFDTRSGAAVSSIDASAPLVCCALSPRRGNDVQAAAADSAGSVSVWRLPSAQLQSRLQADLSPRCCCCFVGPSVLALGDGSGLRVWGVGSEPPPEAAGLACIDASPPVRQLIPDSVLGSSRVLALADGERAARPTIWDARTAALVTALEGHEAAVRHASFSRSGQHAVTLCGRETLRVYDARCGRLVYAVPRGVHFVIAVGLSDDLAFGDRWLVGLGTIRGSAAQLWAQRLPDNLGESSVDAV